MNTEQESLYINIATNDEYWGTEPHTEEQEQELADLTAKIAKHRHPDREVEIDFVPETTTYSNRNSKEADEIVQYAWDQWCRGKLAGTWQPGDA